MKLNDFYIENPSDSDLDGFRTVSKAHLARLKGGEKCRSISFNYPKKVEKMYGFLFKK